MKLVIVLALVAAVAARPDEDFDRYNNFDVNELIANLRLLKAYVLCFLNEGKCTPEGSDFKKWIPDAVQTSCGKCSEQQKSLVSVVIKAIMEKLPEDWAKLSKQFNADGQHDAELNEFLAKYAP
ncbi:allergen Tha p 1-like [Epargyreus clarus]|uniref:allergen Tha p 1-like n=1 Tax=Epargyreus clarus TaxID=520877 RepID=UPI003C2F163A